MERTQLQIREIRRGDNPRVATIIREVLVESGAPTEGTAYADPFLDRMYENYQRPRSRYWVITDGTQIWGGAGVGPLQGAGPETCELQKMYLTKQLRGYGMGEALLELALKTAREFGYTRCYLETMSYMDRALKLYRRHGFEPMEQPDGATGHTACEVWMQKTL